MHKLLKNQIEKYLKDVGSLPPNCQEFLEAVDQAYQDYDSDYERLEHAHDNVMRELKAQSRERELILQSVGSGIIGVDLKGKITFFNSTALRTLGYAPHEILGHSFHKIILHSHSDGTPYWEEASPLRRALANRASYQQSNEVFWKKGQVSFHADYSCTPVLDQEDVKGAVIVFKNISEHILTKQALQRYNHELEERKQDLEDFNTIASHDLKEPLRKIIRFGEMLTKKIEHRLKPKEKEYFSKMIYAAERMDQLITHLLEFSKAGVKSLKFEEIDLMELIEEAANLLEVRIHQAGGKVRVSPAHKHYRPIIHADRNQLHQLFQNLISNGIKYHRPEIPPEVNILIYPHEIGSLKIHVQDNGIGFDESYIQKIFKPFERLHGRSEYEGTGMGLAICQKIVTRHGGSIDVTSQSGEGSTFMITLPIRHLPADKNTPSRLPLENDSKMPVMG